MYHIKFDPGVPKDLSKIHPDIVNQIKDKIYKHLAYLPYELGERLKYKYRGLYRYRHGDYRVVYKILEEKKPY